MTDSLMQPATIAEAFEIIELCEYGGGDGPFHRMPEAIATIKAAASEYQNLLESAAHRHDFVDVSNELVTSGFVCLACGKIK